MGSKVASGIMLTLLLIGMLYTTLNVRVVGGWSNGGYSADPSNPDYGTHDWIAQHALDWLPTQEKQYILDNLVTYLYGTELPDNGGALDGIGDTTKHHIYYNSAEVMTDDAAAVRASTEYSNTLNFLNAKDYAKAAKNAGIMSHYIVDVAVFGHVMGSGTDWGAEVHHSDYEIYVNARTSSYSAEFDSYLSFDGNLTKISAYDAAKNLAYDTTFDIDGDLTCVWMDQNYDWNNSTFKNRAGESLNLAVNYLTDILHTLYLDAAQPRTWTVNDDGPADFHTIQEAINAATDGDTIYVHNGTYYENVVVNKTVWLVGEAKSTTIIDGNETRATILVTANNVNINGFTVQRGGDELLGSYYLRGVGMLLVSVYNNSIHENIITNNTGLGLLLSDSSNTKIRGNTIKNNGNWGIYLFYDCYNNTINGNTVIDNLVAVNLLWSDDNLISENIIANNSYSVELANSNRNMIINNSITNSGSTGIWIDSSEDNIIDGNSIEESGYVGIRISYSSGNTVRENTLTKADIMLDGSDNNLILANTVTDYDGSALWLGGSENNVINANTIENNKFGMWIMDSRAKGSNGNLIYHNNFINNTYQVVSTSVYGFPCVNVWDNGYPSGGNYWSDYDGKDMYSGPYQNETDSDGIGDAAYIIDANNKDKFPLMAPFNAFDAGTWNGITYYVDTVSNSTVSEFYFNPEEGAFIRFNVTGTDGSVGFCRVAIPKQLLWTENTWIVIVGDEPIPSTIVAIIEDASYTYLYFTYTHSTKTVTIIGTHVVPEFPSPIILPLLITLTMLAIVFTKRRLLRKSKT